MSMLLGGMKEPDHAAGAIFVCVSARSTFAGTGPSTVNLGLLSPSEVALGGALICGPDSDSATNSTGTSTGTFVDLCVKQFGVISPGKQSFCGDAQSNWVSSTAGSTGNSPHPYVHI